jgi:putative methyltransferase
MKNVYLVQVVDSYGPNKFLPLAISYHWLNALTDPFVKNNYILKDVLIEKENIDDFIGRIETPDIVIMSCYIWNWNYNRKLAKKIKEKWPNSFIIIGGPQISTTDPLLLKNNKFFDIAVLGENENALASILRNVETKDFNEIKGISLPGKIIPGIDRTVDLDVLPSPILSGFYNSIIKNYEARHNRTFMWQVTYETMRGCPYHCTFCDIGDSYWNKVKTFDTERVYREIDWIAENKIEYVSVCDSNWGMFDRDYDITAYVIKKKIETGYPKVWDVDWAKNNSNRIKKIASLDKDAGTELFKGITFALQSLNQPTLEAIDRFNLSEEVIKESIDYYKQHDIKTYSELIWPMPKETLLSFVQGIQKLIDMGQEHFLMVHPLSLTPNAPMSNSEYLKKYDISYKNVPLDTFWLTVQDVDNYVVETMGTVYSTKDLSFEEVIKGYMFSHWLIVMYYYGWGHYIMKYTKSVLGISETQFILDLIEYIESTKIDIFYKEHETTKQSIEDVILNASFWGIKIDNTYWEYKSATCINFHKSRNTLYDEIKRFLKSVYNLDNKALTDLNMLMCVDWKTQYPIIYHCEDANILKVLFGIEAETVEVSHRDTSVSCEDDFVKIAYHYQRKNQYWKCSIKSVG